MTHFMPREARRAIEEVAAKYVVSVSYEVGGKHPKAILTVPDGRNRFIVCSTSNATAERNFGNIQQDVRRVLKELQAEPRATPVRARAGSLGAVLIEQMKQPNGIEKPMAVNGTNGTSHTNGHTSGEAKNGTLRLPLTETAPQAETADDGDAEGSYAKLRQEEVVQVTRLLLMHGKIDDATKTYTYADGWDDERIVKLLRAVPGRDKLKTSTIKGLRRREFGDLASEKRDEVGTPLKSHAAISAAVGKHDDAIRSIEARLSKLESELGVR